MTSGLALRRFAFAYGAAFAILYVVARVRGLALFTVYPSLGVVLPGMHRSRDVADPAVEFLAPEMWWYGWTATAALGALAAGLFGRIAARTCLAPAMAGMAVAGPPDRDGRLRRPRDAMAATVREGGPRSKEGRATRFVTTIPLGKRKAVL
jgi:hypothetical protein